MPRITHDEFLALAAKRGAARERKDFTEADRIRKQIEEGGFWIEDGHDGYSFGVISENVSQSLAVETVKSRRKKKP